MLKPAKRRLHPGLKQRRFRQRLVAYREAKGPRGRRQIPRAAVPSFFTLMNLFCGFLSLTLALESRFEYAAWLIILAIGPSPSNRWSWPTTSAMVFGRSRSARGCGAPASNRVLMCLYQGARAMRGIVRAFRDPRGRRCEASRQACFPYPSFILYPTM